jgi:glycosyltransferase 2 family protein
LKKILNILRILFFFSIGGVLLWLALRNLSWSNIVEGFKNANYFIIFLALVIGISGHYIRAVRWNILLKPLGYKLSRGNTFIAVLIGYMVNFAVPRMGELSRCIIVNRGNKVPLNQVIGTMIVERIFDTFSLLLIVVVTCFIEFKTLKTLIYDYIYNPLIQKYDSLNVIFLVIIIAIAVVCILAVIYFVRFIRHKSKTNKFAEKVHRLLSGFYSGIKTIKTMEHKWLFVFYTVLMWGTYWGVTYIMFFSTTALSSLSPLAGLSVLAISSLGIVFPSPGGIGTYHYAAILALKFYRPINIADLDWRNASALYTLINHESQMIFLITCGAISYMIFIVNQRKLKENEIIKRD